MHVNCGPIGRNDLIKAWLMGLLEGLHMLKAKGIKECCIEGDLRSIVSWGLKKLNGSWILHHLVRLEIWCMSFK